MQPVVMDEIGLKRTLIRLSHEIREKTEGLENTVIIGVKRGGEVVARRICDLVAAQGENIPCGGIDIGMTRDDLVSAFFVPDAAVNDFGFGIDGKTVVLCDDVLHTGRTAVAAVEALFRLGRPKAVKLLVLVDRGGREVPVRADFVGKNVPTSGKEYISVKLRELGADEDGLFIVKKENGIC